MRRNAPTRHGGPNVPEGPLITEHLKDLDLELELLKRKRQMIEKQHQLYTMPQFKPQNPFAEYEPPRSYNQQPFGSNRDYSHMYNDGPSYSRQQGRKRQADPIWDHDTQPQMFPTKKKPIQSIFGSRLGPKPGPSGPSNAGPNPMRYQKPQPHASHNPIFPMSPVPLMNIKNPLHQKPNKRPLLNTPSGSNKVSKPLLATAPNHLASGAVSKAVKKSAVDESLILRNYRVPTAQVGGRLELTLGNIIKEIKDRYGKMPMYANLFTTMHTQRAMKKAIRERIRLVMMDKVVGSTNDIKIQYRAQYPEETDVDILNVALDPKAVLPEVTPPKKPVESEMDNDVEHPVKTNIYKLIDAKLNEMFTKLKEIYAKEPEGEPGEKKLEQLIIGDVDVCSENQEKADNDIGRKKTSKSIKKFFPRLLNKYHATIIKLIGVDEIYRSVSEYKKSRVEQVETADNRDDEATPGSNQPLLNSLPYYVKIKAKQSLPKKMIMREFLSSFNSKVIKKHKSIHNLLFVGFSELSDYENILKATGTVIGRSVLEITPSEKPAAKPNHEENENLNSSLDKIISPELDGQITDLLISIRQADEEENANDDKKSQESMATSEGRPLCNELPDNAPVIKEEITETLQNDELNKDESAKVNGIILVKSEMATEDSSKTDSADKPSDSSPPNSASETPEKVANEHAVIDAASAAEAPTPAKVAATPAKAAATPAKVAATPAKVAATPAKVAATPAKVAATPAKVGAEPGNVAATPAKPAAATAATVAATPTKGAEAPAKVAETPAKVAATPAKAAIPPKIAATPAKVAETPAKVAATPATVATTPAKVAATPANVAATPAKVAETPAKVAATPAKVAATPAKVAATPEKVAATPAKVAATPAKVAETPAKVAATPAKVAETPAKVAAKPAKVAATPAKVAETPAKVAATPAKVAETPAKVAATPAKVAATPAKVAETPAKVAATPAKVAATPAKVAATPAKVAETPAKVAATPAKVAATPAKVAETPAKVAATPAKVAATPAKVAATPAKVAATPAKVAATPAKAAATPAKVAPIPAKAAATPAKVAPIPAKVAATPAVEAATPAKVAETPAKVANTAAGDAKTPANIAEPPAKVAENPEKVTAASAEVPEGVENVSERLKNVVEDQKPQESVDVESEKSDAVSELKGEAKQTGRSTPTRMTRSANVTPSTIRTRRASRLAQNQ